MANQYENGPYIFGLSIVKFLFDFHTAVGR